MGACVNGSRASISTWEKVSRKRAINIIFGVVLDGDYDGYGGDSIVVVLVIAVIL